MSLSIRVLVAGVLATTALTISTPTAANAAVLQSGTVTSGDGTPLAGATVGVFDPTGKGIAATTTTDVNGNYTLEDCPDCLGSIFATADGYYSSRSGPDFTLFATTNPYLGWSSTTILTFGWDAVPGASGYRLTLADEPTFKHPKIIVKATGTVHTYKQLLKKHLYYLQVYPLDADSHVIRPDRWLGDNHRATVGRTGYVNNLHVTSAASYSLTLGWAPLLFSRCCTEYEVQLSGTPSFTYFRTRFSKNGNNVLTFPHLSPASTYYARVRARNPSHTYLTGWSGIRTVRTS